MSEPTKFQFKKIADVTLPQIKLKDEQTYYFRFDAPMYVGKEVKASADRKHMEPPTLVNVTNLETGEVGVIILNKVFSEVLTEKYADAKYVGKCFSVTLHKLESKRYKSVSLTEIEVTTSEEKPAATVTPIAPPAPAEAPAKNGTRR